MNFREDSDFQDTEIGKIPRCWNLATLGEVVDIFTGFPFKGEKYSHEGIKVVRGENVSEGYLRWDIEKRWKDSFDGLEKYFLKGSDIVVGMDGAKVGLNRVMIKKSDLPLLMAQRMARFRAKGNLDQNYLYYVIFSQRFADYIQSVRTGTTIPHISSKQMSEMIIPIPPISEQKAISKILEPIDDKIELNAQSTNNLEAVAKSIFKHWFIDYEFPNEDGRPYRSSGGSMEYDKVFARELPKGWRMGFLGDVASNLRRGLNPEALQTGTPYIGLEHMPRRSIALSSWDAADNLMSNKFEFREGDILFGKLRPYFHKVGVAPVNGVCSTDILVLAPRSQEWYGFVLFHVSSDNFVRYTDAGSTGTKMPRTDWDVMSRYLLPTPPQKVSQEFNRITTPMIRGIIENIRESNTLREIRNLLLPLLISGKILVPAESR